MKIRLALSGRAAVSCLFLGLLLPPAVLAQAKAEPGKAGSLASAIPSGATGFAETNGLGRLLQRIEGSSYLQQALESPQFQRLLKSPQYKKGDAARQIA